MDKTKFSIPSYLIYAIGAIGLLKYFSYPAPITLSDIALIIFNLFFFVGLGILVRQGYTWTKYIILTLTILSLLNLSSLINSITNSINLANLTFLAQRLLLIITCILLFKSVTKTEDQNTQE